MKIFQSKLNLSLFVLALLVGECRAPKTRPAAVPAKDSWFDARQRANQQNLKRLMAQAEKDAAAQTMLDEAEAARVALQDSERAARDEMILHHRLRKEFGVNPMDKGVQAMVSSLSDLDEDYIQNFLRNYRNMQTRAQKMADARAERAYLNEWNEGPSQTRAAQQRAYETVKKERRAAKQTEETAEAMQAVQELKRAESITRKEAAEARRAQVVAKKETAEAKAAQRDLAIARSSAQEEVSEALRQFSGRELAIAERLIATGFFPPEELAKDVKEIMANAASQKASASMPDSHRVKIALSRQIASKQKPPAAAKSKALQAGKKTGPSSGAVRRPTQPPARTSPGKPAVSKPARAGDRPATTPEKSQPKDDAKQQKIDALKASIFNRSVAGKNFKFPDEVQTQFNENLKKSGKSIDEKIKALQKVAESAQKPGEGGKPKFKSDVLLEELKKLLDPKTKL